MRRFCSLILLLALPALAQSPAQSAPHPKVAPKPPVQRIDFGEDLIPGTIQTPLGTVVVVPEKIEFRSLLLVRDHFNDKLMASVDEM